MKRICILSDTHDMLRDEVKAELAEADIILHAGDIHSNNLLQTMKQYGELYAVCGNNDKDWAEYLPQTLYVSIEGIRFFIVHNKKDIPEQLENVDIVIYGHSHKYEEEIINGILYLNPGSCGRRRFNLELTLCRMIVSGGTYKNEKIRIAHTV